MIINDIKITGTKKFAYLNLTVKSFYIVKDNNLPTL